MCDQTTNTAGQIRAGEIKGYAVTSPERVEACPTSDHGRGGAAGLEVGVWHGLYVPADTADDAVEKLATRWRWRWRTEAVGERMAELGTAPVPPEEVTPQAHTSKLEEQIELWKPIIEDGGAPGRDAERAPPTVGVARTSRHPGGGVFVLLGRPSDRRRGVRWGRRCAWGPGYVPLVLGGGPRASWASSSWPRRSSGVTAARAGRSRPQAGALAWRRLARRRAPVLRSDRSRARPGPALFVATFLARSPVTRPARCRRSSSRRGSPCSAWSSSSRLQLGSAARPLAWRLTMDLLAASRSASRPPSSPTTCSICFLGVLLGTWSACCPASAPPRRWRCCFRSPSTSTRSTALIMLAGIYYGAQYGGSTTAILHEPPGRDLVGGHRHRRIPDGPAGPGGAGPRHGRARLVLRGHGRHVVLALFAPPLARAR